MNKHLLSIIVSFNNNYELINNFLEHLLTVTNMKYTEIIMVSDGCLDHNTLNYIQNKSKVISNLKLISLESQKGYSVANNIGVQNCSGEYLLFINTDVFPEKTSIDRMLKFIMGDPEVGAVQGLLLYPQNGRVQSTGHVFHDYMNNHLYNGRQRNAACVKISGERQALTTAFCIVRKEDFVKFGSFNEFYYNAYDGMEFTLNIQSNGKKCFYLADAIAYHSTGGTRKNVSYNNEYQSKFFYTHNHNKIKSDLTFYLKKQLENIQLQECYFVVNCSFAKNWDLLLKKLDIAHEYCCEISGKSTSNIDLYHNLSYVFLEDQTPLLFIADNYRNLAQNMNWFSIRNNQFDLILDYHGNVITPWEEFQL